MNRTRYLLPGTVAMGLALALCSGCMRSEASAYESHLTLSIPPDRVVTATAPPDREVLASVNER